MNYDETKSSHIVKTKPKKVSKSKNQGNLSCLYLGHDEKGLRRRS